MFVVVRQKLFSDAPTPINKHVFGDMWVADFEPVHKVLANLQLNPGHVASLQTFFVVFDAGREDTFNK